MGSSVGGWLTGADSDRLATNKTGLGEAPSLIGRAAEAARVDTMLRTLGVRRPSTAEPPIVRMGSVDSDGDRRQPAHHRGAGQPRDWRPAAHLSPHAREPPLHVFTKLGLTSRTQLAANVTPPNTVARIGRRSDVPSRRPASQRRGLHATGRSPRAPPPAPSSAEQPKALALLAGRRCGTVVVTNSLLLHEPVLGEATGVAGRGCTAARRRCCACAPCGSRALVLALAKIRVAQWPGQHVQLDRVVAAGGRWRPGLGVLTCSGPTLSGLCSSDLAPPR